MPRTARLDPLPQTPMERPPVRTPATRCRSRSHRGGTAELEDRRLTHGLTSGDLCRVGQAPRRALRLTQSNVGKLTDERLPWRDTRPLSAGRLGPAAVRAEGTRSEEHTSELQSRLHLVCRLLLEKKIERNCDVRESRPAASH